ncbi:Traf4 TNF receptor-associated factor 4 [Candida maltosa Xu316]
MSSEVSDTSQPEEVEVSDYEYDDTPSIENFPTSFNLLESNDRPDLRNLVYKSTTDHLNCAICQQPFINPLTTICGHTFCKECIYECFRMTKRNNNDELTGYCPLDRTPLDAANINDVFPTPLIVTNLIDELKVYCLNKERGCDWVGTRWEMEHHVMDTCLYTGVRCDGKRADGSNCKLVIERRFEDKSSNDCVHKIFECEFCNEKLTKITQAKHLETKCLFNYKTCEICGNDMIPEKNMTKHQENCVKIGKFRCPANEIGCKWIGTNEASLELHLENNCQLYQFLPSYNSMMDKITSLTSENDFLQKQINKILDSIIQGKITNLGYSESIEEINKFGSIEDQDKLIYLNFEIDRLKYEINERLIPFMNKHKVGEQDTVMNNLINDNFMMREDMNLQRMMINSLRKQLQFLLFSKNRSGGGVMPTFLTNDDHHEVYDNVSRSNSEERLNIKL